MPQSIQGFSLASPYIAELMRILDSRNIQIATPFGIANTGVTVANALTGNVTLGTALARIYAGGAWMYFPSTAWAAPFNVAGWYWVVFSSTTIGQGFSDPTLTVPLTGQGGAYTGVITEQALPLNLVVPGGMLGLHGGIRATIAAFTNNSAGAKTLKWKIGGTLMVTNSSTTTTLSTIFAKLQNLGSQLLQNLLTLATNAAATAVADQAFNMAADQIMTVTIQIAVATDVIVVNGMQFELNVS